MQTIKDTKKMKTKKEVLQDNSNFKTLINAVINNIGIDSIQDVNNYGIDGGFNGFIYYSDTHSFAIKHRRQIIELLEYTAEQFGEDVPEMVAGFGVFRRSPMDAEDKRDLYRYLGGGKVERGEITNIMAWFGAEEVCRMFDN